MKQQIKFYGKYYWVFYYLNNAFLLLLAVVCILPMVNVLAVSFSAAHYAAAGRVGFWPVGFTTASYKIALSDAKFWNSLRISLIRTIGGTAINVVLTTLAAYPLSKDTKYFPSRDRYMMFVFITMVFGGGLVPGFLVVYYTGLYNTIWSLIIPGAVSGWNVVLMLNFFRQLPKEIEEAAIIDGAGHMRILTQIIVPVSKASIATITLFCLVGHWNDWFGGMLYMSTSSRYPLATYLQSLLSVDVARYMPKAEREIMALLNTKTLKAALVFINAAPIIAVYPFLQKHFTKGLVLGSVKG
ncbi:sugar ABC transporter permease [Clostridia bacterium]|nr:sugar ABC transporter permease [Clostridia bacterium]